MSGGPFIKRPLRAELKTPSLAKDQRRRWHDALIGRCLRITGMSEWAPDETEALRHARPLMPIVESTS
jgi:hypothetical protein